MADLRESITACLYGTGDDQDSALETLPDHVPDPVDAVHQALQRSWQERPTGIRLGEHFEMPHLAATYPDEEFSLCVPADYSPDRAVGLLVLLHGGGIGSPRTSGRQWLLDEDNSGGYHFGGHLQRRPYITVAPGNLLLDTYKRWSTPESDAYVLAVIEEVSYRYHIDPDRVMIAGQSMGGFGAYHVAQTIGDRFASIGCHAGAWFYGFWEGLRGVDVYTMHGVADAAPGVRPRFTDVAFARFFHASMSGFHISHEYIEHDGGHSFSDPSARAAFLGFLDHAETARREPFPKEVVTASRKGAFQLQSTPHFFWITISPEHYDTMCGTFELDHVETTESQPSFCTTDFRHRIISVPGATVHARNHGGNHIEIHTRNVYDVTIWFHRDMVAFDQPITITVNGRERFRDVVRPSLRTAVESYMRRRDPGSICPANVTLTLKVDDQARIQESPRAPEPGENDLP